jgi:predicted transglutaminase-like cysteine proteinase
MICEHGLMNSFFPVFFRYAAAVAVTAVLSAQPAFAMQLSYFDMNEKRSDNISPFPKWTGMIARYDSQKQYAENSDCGQVRFNPCSAQQWQDGLAAMKGRPFAEQMEMVNNWGNLHPYIEDQINWGLEDYWETPNEFMEVNGDCEDYAIAKYYSLRALGISADRLRVIILQDLNLGGVIHAVLGVYDEHDVLYILDNQSQQVTPAMRIYHYRPIFGINEDSWWAYYPRS